MKTIDNTTNTAVCIRPKPISNTIFTNGMTGMENHPKKPLIRIAITDPLTTLPNKRKQSEIGKDISLIIFIGNIIGFGSKNPFKYPKNPLDTIPANWITKNDPKASVKVTIRYPVGFSNSNTADIFDIKINMEILKNQGENVFHLFPILCLINELIKSTNIIKGTNHKDVFFNGSIFFILKLNRMKMMHKTSVIIMVDNIGFDIVLKSQKLRQNSLTLHSPSS